MCFRFFISLTLILLLTVSRSHAQEDVWVGLQQNIDVKKYAGKPFRYSGAIKINEPASV
ncbi:MAG: hypothetical protein ICV53_15970, partial [Flavisolibacter sp.]|nr:hypothetical protein [Flavisolibacter sp.]